MKYLIVVAHPDDEVLGAGASIKKWATEGNAVDVCIMCTEAKAPALAAVTRTLNKASDSDRKGWFGTDANHSRLYESARQKT